MLEPQIIYEDADVLVINKPAGLEVLEILNWAQKKFPTAHLAHRLDKETSGVMILAKNEASWEYLKNLFQTRKIQKKYLALVYGRVKNDPPAGGGVIDWAIGRSRKDPRRRIALPPEKQNVKSVNSKFREAVTEYSVLKRFANHAYLEARPKTGRTHQIRVHLKALGYPILGDKLYAPESLLETKPQFSRQALHAASLKLVLPSGEKKEFHAELPEGFTSLLANLRAS